MVKGNVTAVYDFLMGMRGNMEDGVKYPQWEDTRRCTIRYKTYLRSGCAKLLRASQSGLSPSP